MIKVAAASWLVAQPAVFDLAADEKVVEQTLCEGRRREEEGGCVRVRDMGGTILWVTKTRERERSRAMRTSVEKREEMPPAGSSPRASSADCRSGNAPPCQKE